MNAKELADSVSGVAAYSGITLAHKSDELAIVLRALRLLAAAEANDGARSQLIEDLRTEADLCRNETAEDIAELLDDAASSIIAISAMANALKDERNGLAARVAELEPDAERYRWMRDQPTANIYACWFPPVFPPVANDAEQRDRAIDAARSK